MDHGHMRPGGYTGTLPWLSEADADVVAELKARATAEDVCGVGAHPEVVEFVRLCCKNDHHWKPDYDALAARLQKVLPGPPPCPRILSDVCACVRACVYVHVRA